MVLHRLYERARGGRGARDTRASYEGEPTRAPSEVLVLDLIAEARLAERSDAGARSRDRRWSGRLGGVQTGVHATLDHVEHVAASGVPAPEKPALASDERAARLKLLAQRLRDPDGLDRDTLAEIEQLTAHEQ